MDRQVQGLIAELRALRLREERVIERLEEADRGNEAASITRHKYKKGDRVFIKNKVRKPVKSTGEWSAAKERHATVKLIVDKEGDRIHLRTDNNTHTWRAHKNVTALPREPTL
jgi:hypothetical protein